MNLDLTFIPGEFLESSIFGGIFILSIFFFSFIVALVAFVILKQLANRLSSANSNSVLSEILHSIRKSVFVLILLIGNLRNSFMNYKYMSLMMLLNGWIYLLGILN